MAQYSLENLWKFSDSEIKQILYYFGVTPIDKQNDRFNSIILSFNNNLLVPEDRYYVSSPYFKQLFFIPNDQLIKQYGILDIHDHIEIIKFIINNLTPTYNNSIILSNPIVGSVSSITPTITPTITSNIIPAITPTITPAVIPTITPTITQITSPNVTNFNPIISNIQSVTPTRVVIPIIPKYNIISNKQTDLIKVVNNIPTNINEKIAIYQMNENIYVCGKGTYEYRESLRELKGKWNPEYKCWTLPLIKREEIIKIFSPEIQIKNTERINIPEIIPIINKIPKRHIGGLQAYQMNGQILLCGSKINSIQSKIRKIGGKFNEDINCWIFGPEKAQDIINLIDITKEESKIRKEEKLIHEREESERLYRLQNQEQEAIFINNLKKLSPEIIEQATINGTYDQLIAQMANLDAQELRKEWGDKIKILKSSSINRTSKSAIVTYMGDIKPPDLALILAVDGWWPSNFGGNIKRIDYKTYDVKVYID